MIHNMFLQFWKTGCTILIAGRTFIVDDCCDVCGGDNDRRNNKLLTCQLCHMSVHQVSHPMIQYNNIETFFKGMLWSSLFPDFFVEMSKMCC